MIKIGGKGYLETKENWKIQKDFPNMKLKFRKRKEGYGVQKIDWESSGRPPNTMQSSFAAVATGDYSKQT